MGSSCPSGFLSSDLRIQILALMIVCQALCPELALWPKKFSEVGVPLYIHSASVKVSVFLPCIIL